MEDTQFKELFQRIAAQYALAPDVAEALLQRILKILWDSAQSDKYP